MHLKRTGILTKAALLILLAYALVSLMTLRGKIDDATREKAELERQVAAIAAENDAMQYAVDNSEDDDVIRDIAREKLNLVEPGEEVYYAG